MRSTLTVLALATVLVTGSFTARVSGSTGPIPLNCDRACLEGLIDQYLAAVVAHDPSKLPLSKDVKYSENYQMLQVGDGFWKTASGIGSCWGAPKERNPAPMTEVTRNCRSVDHNAAGIC
jgi:hypothetical protein